MSMWCIRVRVYHTPFAKLGDLSSPLPQSRESGRAHAWSAIQACLNSKVGSNSIWNACHRPTKKKTTTHIGRSLATCETAGFAGKPLFLAGCSLGGCIAVHAAHQRPGLFRGVALLAPMLSLERASRHGLNPYLRPLAGLISWLVPTAPIAATTRNTLYPHLQARACIPSQTLTPEPHTVTGEGVARHGLKTPTCARWPAPISWLAPTAPIAATARDTLCPHLRARPCIQS